MKNELMDCTLRDGGYLNNWQFTDQFILDLIKTLDLSGIDNIECGYLSTALSLANNSTKFSEISVFNRLISTIANDIKSKLFLMIDFSEYNPELLPEANSESQYISGIRLAFHKKDATKLRESIKIISAKGYRLFLQPMITNMYSETELLQLIDSINDLKVDSFFIVDSFGNISPNELKSLYSLILKNLNPSVNLGFHPHNNTQMAYANSIEFFNFANEGNSKTHIVDSSVMGVGRGGGNLNTEIIINYLNKFKNKKYNDQYILRIIDENMLEIFKNKEIYSKLPYYFSANRGCHPNYSSFFLSKNLPLLLIKTLIDSIDEKQLSYFNSDYAESLLAKEKSLCKIY
jgi:isopropylmalate/homocitrate/citramalate synthase